MANLSRKRNYKKILVSLEGDEKTDQKLYVQKHNSKYELVWPDVKTASTAAIEH